MNVLLARLSILSVFVLAVAAAPARGQSPTVTSVPRILRVTSTFHPADGKPPAAVETMTLSIYAEEIGGVPLWQETQTVSVNPDGRFTLLLGSTRPEGLPLDLFASGEPRWLAIRSARPGEGEPARIRLLMLNGVITSPAAANTADSLPPEWNFPISGPVKSTPTDEFRAFIAMVDCVNPPTNCGNRKAGRPGPWTRAVLYMASSLIAPNT